MREVRAGLIAALCIWSGQSVGAQVIEKVTFEEAVRRAIVNNPTVQRAAADVVRAQAVELQVRSRTLPILGAALTNNVIDPITRFSGSAITPRSQAVTSAELFFPVFAPVRWAERNQAADEVIVAERTADEARREIGFAAGDAYLSIIALHQVVQLNETARDNARAHYELAEQRFQGGIGSRLNAVRAQQEVSMIEARVEEARLGVRRAQETLGVLIAADGPVDVANEPTFDVPSPDVPDGVLVGDRDDIRQIQSREAAAQRRAADAWKDRLPTLDVLFAPQVITPSGLFANSRSWRAAVLFAVPIFDGGLRTGQARERFAFLDVVRAERTEAEREAISEIRVAREAVAYTERALAFARVAAEQANEVVRITDIAFREGANTNIELIDAQREARDAETAAAVAAHGVRRAHLELLYAMGLFPQ
jgi:outer membrane protein TolC